MSSNILEVLLRLVSYQMNVPNYRKNAVLLESFFSSLGNSESALLYWSKFKYEFIGFTSSSFTLISVNSKVF